MHSSSIAFYHILRGCENYITKLSCFKQGPDLPTLTFFALNCSYADQGITVTYRHSLDAMMLKADDDRVGMLT